jgi:hypothetical protein
MLDNQEMSEILRFLMEAGHPWSAGVGEASPAGWADDRLPPAGKPAAIRPRSVIEIGAQTCPQDRPHGSALRTSQPRRFRRGQDG